MMKKHRKLSAKLLSLVLTLAILFSMAGMNTAFANQSAVAERGTILNLNLNNNALTDKDGNMLPAAADGIYDMLAAEGWKWDNNTLTLTLNGLNMNVLNSTGVLLPANATIGVVGSNSIVCGSYNGVGIMGFENVTIQGDGTIDIDSKVAGIHSDGDLSIAGATINVTAEADSAILAVDTLNISGSADVTTSAYYCGIQANGNGINISGATVKAESSNDSAIFTKGTLTISASAEVTAEDALYSGIEAKGDITITDSTVKAKSGTDYTGIYTPQSVVIGGDSNVTADGDFVGILGETSISIGGSAEVTATGKSMGLQSMDTQISGNAVVEVTSIDASAISGKDNLSITGNAEVTATGAQAGIVSNGSMTLSAKDIKATGGWYGIDNEGVNASGITIGGKLTAEATAGHGIYGAKNITADSSANIAATGSQSGIQTVGDITFTGSKVDAIGKGGCGINSKGKITITEGSVHAKGSAGYTAIRAENVQTTGEAAESKISLTNVLEKNGGKVAFSGWVSNNGETISWTTFIVKDDDGIITTPDGGFTNGLLEVWLTAPYLVDDSTGIKVEYEDGTPFDDDVVLNITSQPQAEMDKFKDAIDKVAPGLTLGGLYDISLLKGGVEIQPNGKIKVSIPLTDAMKAMTDLKVVYINDDGNATIIPSQIVDGKIVFVIDHLSYYGVVGKVKTAAPGDNNDGESDSQNYSQNSNPNNSPQTGNSSPTLLHVLMMGVLGTTPIILGKKRKVFKHLKK